MAHDECSQGRTAFSLEGKVTMTMEDDVDSYMYEATEVVGEVRW